MVDIKIRRQNTTIAVAAALRDYAEALGEKDILGQQALWNVAADALDDIESLVTTRQRRKKEKG